MAFPDSRAPRAALFRLVGHLTAGIAFPRCTASVAAHEAEPARVFDTAAEAMAFLRVMQEHAQRTRPVAA